MKYMLDHIYGKAYIRAMDINPDNVFKALADPTRLRCLMLLTGEAELCVCEFTHALDEIQPKISRHLASLRDQGMVLDRRQGQWVYYRLNPGLPGWVTTVLRETLQGVGRQKVFARDRKRLDSMANRPGQTCCA